MRKVIASTFVTLDGLMVGPNEEMDWVLDNLDGEMENDIADQLKSVDAILLGRVTYQIMANYWPTATAAGTSVQRSQGVEDPIITDRMNNLPKIVFSKTLQKVEWKNSRLIKENIKEEILKIKQQPGKDMVILGSASIVQTFTNLGLIDEYRLLLHPVALGSGKPLFKDINDRLNLKLLKTKTYKNGVVSFDYQPIKK
jgi:dihydrofolate reductase